MGFSYNVNVLNQKGSPAIYTDTFANRPAFGFAGRLFIANDTAAIYEDTGTAWVLIANVSSGAGTLQQVTTNGNTSNVGISVTAGGVSSNSLTVTTLTPGSVPFVGTAGLITQDNTNLFFDDTNNRLGINTNTPSNNLDVHGTGTSPLIAINNTAGNQSLIGFAKNSTAKWRIGNSSSDTFDVLNVGLTTNAITISSATNIVSFIESIKISQTSAFQATAGFNSIIGTANGFGFQLGTSTINPTFAFNVLTASRNYIFPDATGTIALTSNLSSYLPLTGGTLTGALNGTTAEFSSNLYTKGDLEVRPSGVTRFLVTTSIGGDGLLILNDAIAFNQVQLNANGFSYLKGGRLGVGSSTDDTINALQVTGKGKFSDSSQGLIIGAYVGGAGFGAIYPSTVTPSISNHCLAASSSATVINTGTGGVIDFEINVVSALLINTNRTITIGNLAGTGSRAVLADASGNLSAPVSDITVKENIEPLKYGLDTIMKLNVVQFEFIEEYKNYGEGLQIGAIAQEVEQIIPEAVFKTPSTGLKGINYNQFNGIYIKAIQDQQKIIESLIQRIEILENK